MLMLPPVKLQPVYTRGTCDLRPRLACYLTWSVKNLTVADPISGAVMPSTPAGAKLPSQLPEAVALNCGASFAPVGPVT